MYFYKVYMIIIKKKRVRKMKKSSEMIDTRLYDNPFLLSKILCELDNKLTEEEKEYLKIKFLRTYKNE